MTTSANHFSTLAWCHEQARNILAIAGNIAGSSSDNDALCMICSLASDIAINLEMAMAPPPKDIQG